jgi:hypothetical protein
VRHKKFSEEEIKYWAQVSLICSQITFGVFWATIILPREVDQDKLVMILSNLIASLALWFCGWTLIRRK